MRQSSAHATFTAVVLATILVSSTVLAVDLPTGPGQGAEVVGGTDNVVNGDNGVVLGGRTNAVIFDNGAVVGGEANIAGRNGFVGGGVHNAAGTNAAAFGSGAHALHPMTLVFNGGEGNLSTTGPGQVLFGAPGGLGINTTELIPGGLSVGGGVMAPYFTGSGSQLTGIVGAGQACPTGMIAMGSDDNGTLACAALGYGDLQGLPDLSSVATSGLYTDLAGRPVLVNLDACPDGTVLSGFDGNGTLQCGAVSYLQMTDLPTLVSLTACEQGSMVVGFSQDGTLQCAALPEDKDTTYTNGTGLSLIDGAFGLKPIEYTSILGTPTLATVAGTGAYDDLTGTPVFAAVATSGAYGDLLGAPELSAVAASGSYLDLADRPALVQLEDCQAGMTVVGFGADGVPQCATLAVVAGTGKDAVVGGSSANEASGTGSTVFGGFSNGPNKATAYTAAVGGGYGNIAGGQMSVVSGGSSNEALGQHSNIAGGWVNQADGRFAAVLGGQHNRAQGNNSVVLGGQINSALATNSLAAGTRAYVLADDDGAFVWADAIGKNFLSNAPNEFAARATGGFRFVTAVDTDGDPVKTVVMDATGLDPAGLQPCDVDGQVLAWTAEAGWMCTNDQVVEYTAGEGLSLVDRTFSLDPIDYAAILNTPALAQVATSGNYSHLSNLPELAAVATTGAYSDLTGIPLFANVASTGAYADLTGLPTLVSLTACEQGSMVVGFSQDGTLQCAALPEDKDTTYTNGTGLSLIDGAFGLKPVQYTSILGTPTLATVATTGEYDDLTGTPALANVATSGAYADLTGLPTLVSLTACEAGSMVVGFAPDGTLQCAVLPEDKDTTYTNGTGLSLIDGAFDLKPIQYVDVQGTPSLAVVATSGAYADLSGTPSLATVATSGAYGDLTGTPQLATVATTGQYNDLAGAPTCANVGEVLAWTSEADWACTEVSSGPVRDGDQTGAVEAGDPSNAASGSYSTVGGGFSNTAGGASATVGGGDQNTASAGRAAVGGGTGNTASGGVATVAGGSGNTASGLFATVSGGDQNMASEQRAAVGGGQENTASGQFGMVGGGLENTASGQYGTVGGGRNNWASGWAATVDGGFSNEASGQYGTVGGGQSNTASGQYDTVAGGFGNQASGEMATVGGGRGNKASGQYGTVAGGFGNDAAGAYSFVAGRVAHTTVDGAGSFVWADNNTADYTSAAANEFKARATGGFEFCTAISGLAGVCSNGVKLAASGDGWTTLAGDPIGGVTSYTDLTDKPAFATVATSGAYGDLTGTPQLATVATTGQYNDLAGAPTCTNVGEILAWTSDGDWACTVADQGVTYTNGTGLTLVDGTFSVVPIQYADVQGAPSLATVATSGSYADLTSTPSIASSAGSAPDSVIGNGNIMLPEEENTATSDYATVAGGRRNNATGPGAAVGGGIGNVASGEKSTISGGQTNTAAGLKNTISGGSDNAASAVATVIGGGTLNVAMADFGTVGGGNNNNASGYASAVGGGQRNEASGARSTIPGGQDNVAAGAFSFAAGKQAEADHNGAFVWADHSGTPFSSTAHNEFSARAVGGVRLCTNADCTAGQTLAGAGSTWQTPSAKELKQDFEALDRAALLDSLQAMQIEAWSYKAEPEVRHIGPYAAEWSQTFGLGLDDQSVTELDLAGVALVAAQGLADELDAEKERNDELEARIAQLEAQVAASDALEARLAALEANLGVSAPQHDGHEDPPAQSGSVHVPLAAAPGAQEPVALHAEAPQPSSDAISSFTMLLAAACAALAGALAMALLRRR